MHNIFLFARREYLETVRKKSFIVMTILLPALMFGFTVLPSMMASKKSGEAQHIVIATSDRQFGSDVRDKFMETPPENKTPAKRRSERVSRNFDIQIDTNVSAQEEDALTQRVNTKEIDGYLWAPPDALAQRKLNFRARTSSDFETQGALGSAVREALLRQSLRKHGVSADEITAALKPVDIDTKKIENGKVSESGGLAMFFTSLLLMIMLYVTILMYSMSVMRSVLEEKNSRIFEVLLSAATPKELMAGKILGAAAVGLTQIAIWTLAATPFAAQSISMYGEQFHLNLSVANMIFFGVFFILGFLLYSALAAAVSVRDHDAADRLGNIHDSGNPAATLDARHRALANSILCATIDVYPHPGGDAASLADRIESGSAGRHHLRDAGDLLAHLPHRNPHVRQTANAAGNFEMDEVRVAQHAAPQHEIRNKKRGDWREELFAIFQT
jgi:ABC-2 type transport system permease protein